MKTKYAIPKALVDDLIMSGMVSDETEAMEKVASGEALDVLRSSKNRKLQELQIEYRHLSDASDGLSDMAYSEFDRAKTVSDDMSVLEEDIEEIDRLIELRDAPPSEE